MEKLQVFGSLMKVENLWCLEEYGIKNTCILESFKGYPGYYGNSPVSAKPFIVYIVSDQDYTMEDIIRISKKVKAKLNIDINVAFSKISIYPETCCAVRIAGANGYAEIKKIQETYRDCGFVLKRKVRGVVDAEANIKVYKFFSLEKFNENIFFDLNDANIGYFKVKEYIEWGEFANRIKMLRSNLNTKMFDAAQSFIYKDGEIIDMIRIFSINLSSELLKELSEKYYSLFEKY